MIEINPRWLEQEKPKKITGIEKFSPENDDEIAFIVSLNEEADFDDIKDEIERTYGAYISEELVKSGIMNSENEGDSVSMSAYPHKDKEGKWKIILTYIKSKQY